MSDGCNVTVKYSYRNVVNQLTCTDDITIKDLKAEMFAIIHAGSDCFELKLDQIYLMDVKPLSKYDLNGKTVYVVNVKRKFKVEQGGKIFNFNLTEETSIADLKRQIGSKANCSMDSVNLEYNSQILDPNKKIIDYDIYSEEIGATPMIICIARQKGGIWKLFF